MKRNLIGSLIVLLFLPSFLISSTRTNKQENFRLINAEKMYLYRQLNEQILELNGKVHFFYGQTEFKSDRAVIYDTQKIARMYGNVQVSNDTLVVVADTVAYYRIPEQLNMGSNVLITETKPDGSLRWFRSHYGAYDRIEDKITVWKNVRAYDKTENAHIDCGYAFWDRKAGYAFMIEEPRLVAGTTDTLRISSEKMEFFDQERKLIATFNVRTQTRDYNVSSDFLIYFLREDKAVFTGQPVFKSDFATATASEFYLYMEDRKLTRAELKDSCSVHFAEEANAEQKNWVRASFIEIEFRDDIIKKFIAEEKVSYYYHQAKTDKRDFMLNEATGDFLEANFNDDNKLDIMRMKKGIKGKYKFHNNS